MDYNLADSFLKTTLAANEKPDTNSLPIVWYLSVVDVLAHFRSSPYNLPNAISANQNDYDWSPRQYTGESVILLVWNLKDTEEPCSSVEKGPENAPY